MAPRVRSRRQTEISDLPQELISAILTRLGNRADIFRSRTVCNKWRSSFPLSPNPNPNPNLLSPILPLNIPNSANLPFAFNEDLILVATATFLIQPLDNSTSEGWILSVDEVQQGKLRFLNPLSRDHVTNLPHDFPNSLDLSQFHVSQIANGYNFQSEFNKCMFHINKVVIFPTMADVSASIDDYVAMVLLYEGNLCALGLGDQKWSYVRHSLVCALDDIVVFKGMLCVVDRMGKVYAIDCKTLEVAKTMVDVPICNGGKLAMRKRLVESCGELYLVVRLVPTSRIRAKFDVFKLNEMVRNWDKVDSLGDRVMFMTRSDCCFIVSTGKIQGCEGNCIVFPQGCFASYDGFGVVDIGTFASANREDFKMGVFHLLDGENFGFVSSYSSLSKLLWPPPTWFWPTHIHPADMVNGFRGRSANCVKLALCLSKSGCEEEVQSGLRHQNSLVEDQKKIMLRRLKKCFRRHCAMNGPKNVNGGTTAEVMSPLHSTSSILSPQQPSDINSSMVKFHGVNVRSELAPILEEVWSKYGNIVEGSAISSCDIIATALESVAKLIIILQSSSAKTLTDHQAYYLFSTLSDLQHMQLKVNWLVPLVEKAMSLHKSVPLSAVLVELRRQTRAQEVGKKFLTEVAELEQFLEHDTEPVSV